MGEVFFSEPSLTKILSKGEICLDLSRIYGEYYTTFEQEVLLNYYYQLFSLSAHPKEFDLSINGAIFNIFYNYYPSLKIGKLFKNTLFKLDFLIIL
jgi:hypothetical protein